MNIPAPFSAPIYAEVALATGIVPTTLPSNTVPTSSKAVFFSDTFPRELRDEIYDHLYQHSHHKLDDAENNIMYDITTPLVAPRLFNRQFKLEYDERCTQNRKMSRLLVQVSDHSAEYIYGEGDDDSHLQEKKKIFEFTGPAAHATKMTIVLSTCFCYPHESPFGPKCKFRSTFNKDRLMSLTNPMQNLRCVHIYLEVPEKDCLQKILLDLNADITASGGRLENAQYKDIFEFKVLYPGRSFVKGRDNKILATWSKQNGLEIEDEAVKQSFAQTLAEQEPQESRPSKRRRVAAGGS